MDPKYIGCEREPKYFKKIAQIGRGTYGHVFIGQCGDSTDKVAIKKMIFNSDSDGFPYSTLREIRILSSFKHPNIIELKEVATCKSEDNPEKEDVYLVFEYADADLSGIVDLVKDGGMSWFSEEQIKCYAYQLLKAINFLHLNNIVHRDIKLSNILISRYNEIKLADFGLSRIITRKAHKYTSNVITLWYRPPELILGELSYKFEIDMWSIGCVITALFITRHLFLQHDELKMLQAIFTLLGTPTKECQEYYNSLPRAHLIKTIPSCKNTFENFVLRNIWEQRGPTADLCPDAMDLISKLLALDPKQRISAADALEHKWFKDVIDPHYLPPLPLDENGIHEYQSLSQKRKRDNV